MKRVIIRRALTAFLLLVLVSLAGGPCASAEESAALPLNYLEGGKPPKADGGTFNGEGPVSYEDSTIRVTFEREVITHMLYCGNRQGERKVCRAG